MIETAACPDPECQAPAEVLHRFDLWSTEGPIEHISTRCVLGHHFTVATGRRAPAYPFSASAAGLGLLTPEA